MDSLLDTLRTTSRSLGAGPRCPEISTSECNSKEKTLTMSEHWALSWSVAEVDEPHDSQTRDPELHSRFGNSFGEIVRNRNSKKTKKFFAETNAGPEQAGSGPENNSDSENIALIALLSELPSNKNKALQEPTKASAQVELEGSFDMTTSSLETEQESTSSNCDLKATRLGVH